MEQVDLTEQFLELVRRTSTDLPPDVEKTLRKGRDAEEKESAAHGALSTILKNVEMAREQSTPICQDTGTPIFHVHYPQNWSTARMKKQINDALIEATRIAYLRPNAVDSLTGKNSGNNTGEAYPYMHFEEWDEDAVQVSLLLKGGGCENVGIQYSLPNGPLGAGRDLEGVRRVVLDGVNKAQGLGCAPGTLGIALGGDRGISYLRSKEQLLRKLDDTNPNAELARLEERLLEEANELGIGPMGFGGRTTVLGVKIGTAHRLPACYFVTISYMCWAHRRRTMVYRDGAMEIS